MVLARLVRAARRDGKRVVVSVRGRNPATVRRDGACPITVYWFTDLEVCRRTQEDDGTRYPPHLTDWVPESPVGY